MKALLVVLVLASLGLGLTLEVVVTEADLQEALEGLIEDTRISSVIVDIQEGIIVIDAVRELANQSIDIQVIVWLNPESDENVWAVRSGTANDRPMGDERLELWNEWFNQGMHNMAQTELCRADSIIIEPDRITFIWD